MEQSGLTDVWTPLAKKPGSTRHDDEFDEEIRELQKQSILRPLPTSESDIDATEQLLDTIVENESPDISAPKEEDQSAFAKHTSASSGQQSKNNPFNPPSSARGYTDDEALNTYIDQRCAARINDLVRGRIDEKINRAMRSIFDEWLENDAATDLVSLFHNNPALLHEPIDIAMKDKEVVTSQDLEDEVVPLRRELSELHPKSFDDKITAYIDRQVDGAFGNALQARVLEVSAQQALLETLKNEEFMADLGRRLIEVEQTRVQLESFIKPVAVVEVKRNAARSNPIQPPLDQTRDVVPLQSHAPKRDDAYSVQPPSDISDHKSPSRRRDNVSQDIHYDEDDKSRRNRSRSGHHRRHGRSRSRRSHHSRRRRYSSSSRSRSHSPSSSYNRARRWNRLTSAQASIRNHLLDLVEKQEKEFLPRDTYPRAFRAAVDYRNYRLSNTDPMFTSRSMHKSRKYLESMSKRIQPTFTGQDPVAVLRFVSQLANACDAENIAEGDAMWLFTEFMSPDAAKRLSSRLGSARFGNKVTPNDKHHLQTYIAVVRHLINTYATDEALQNAFSRLRQFRMLPGQTAVAYGQRLRDEADRFGTAFDEDDLIEIFMAGVRQDLVRSVRHYWSQFLNHPNRDMSIDQGQSRLTLLMNYTDTLYNHDVPPPDKTRSHNRSDRRQYTPRISSVDPPTDADSPTPSPSVAPISTSSNSRGTKRTTDSAANSAYNSDNVSELMKPPPGKRRTPQGRAVRYGELFRIPPNLPDITDAVNSNINSSSLCRFCLQYKFTDDPQLIPHESSDCHICLPADPVGRYNILATRLSNVKSLGPGRSRTGSHRNGSQQQQPSQPSGGLRPTGTTPTSKESTKI